MSNHHAEVEAVTTGVQIARLQKEAARLCLENEGLYRIISSNNNQRFWEMLGAFIGGLALGFIAKGFL